MATPYTFQPVIPTEQMIDLGGRLFQGNAGLAELKDASGIVGCILEKYDGVEIGTAVETPLGASLEELGDQLRSSASVAEGDSAEALNIAIFLPLIMRIIELILSRIGNGGEDGGPV